MRSGGWAIERSGGWSVQRSSDRALGRSGKRLGRAVGRWAIRVGSLTSRHLRFEGNNKMFSIYRGLGGRRHDPNGRTTRQEPFARRSQEKQTNGLRHPSKKKAQGSKSSKPSRRDARFQKCVKSRHHARTIRKFQKLQTVETGGPLLRKKCKPSRQNAFPRVRGRSPCGSPCGGFWATLLTT